MIASLNSSYAIINLQKLIQKDNGREYYVVHSVKRFGPTCMVTLEKVDLQTCSLTGQTIEVSGDLFQEGSGFGGLPYFKEAYCATKYKDGVFYCDLPE